MTSFAIYEIIGLILALPLSYAMAYFARKYSRDTYRDEADRLFSAIWNGEEEDELNAWLRVKQIFLNKKAPKKKKYIQRKINALNKHHFYGNTYVTKEGEFKEKETESESNPVH